MVSHAFKRNNTAKKKRRPAYRPKIRWELFGLANSEPTELPIETIRSAVSALAGMRLAREPVPGPSIIKKKTSKSSLRERR
jgi:hypothetical protein